MRRRLAIGAFAAIVGLISAAVSVPLHAQGAARPSASSRSSASSAMKYVQPRTPWGDPDISGTWSSDDLRGVPVQRPDQFAGRAELSDEEFAKRQADNNDTR